MPHAFLILCVLASLSVALSEHPLLLLISLDGFRHDLVNDTFAPNIHKFAQQGAWFTNGSQSQYVTFTAPNHMSLATGLYEESHGILSNYFYDARDSTYFDYFRYSGAPNARAVSLRPKWFAGEPIWITNERAGATRRSAVLDWPMAEANYSGRPFWRRAWRTEGTLDAWKADVEQLLGMLTRREQPVNLAVLYIAQPDTVLHEHGFYDGEFAKTMRDVDAAFGYLTRRVDELALADRLNIVLTADHGHAQIAGYKSLFCIGDYVRGLGVHMSDHMIYPSDEAHAQAVYANLTRAVRDGYQIDVSWRRDLPPKYHYNSSRVGRILITPRVGAGISFSCSRAALEAQYGPNGNATFHKSTHGQDPEAAEMRALLVLRGPAFEPRRRIAEVPQNVDVYALMCQLLGVPPAPNNGSMAVLSKALRPAAVVVRPHSALYDVFTDSMGILTILAPSTCIVLLILFIMCKQTVLNNNAQWTRPEATRGYRPLSNQHDEELADVVFSRRDNPAGAVKIANSKSDALLEAATTSEDDEF